MNSLKNSIKEHAFNETKMFAQLRLENLKKERMYVFMNKKMFVSLGVVAAMVIAITLGTAIHLPSPQKTPNNSDAVKYAQVKYSEHPLAAAMISVEITPSFEIYTDAAGKVVEIEAINPDAQTLDVSALIGLPVNEAISGIIASATAAGFINSTDATDDYVIVSTVMLDTADTDSGKKQDAIDEMITKGLEADTSLPDTTKVAVIKASQEEMFQANGKDVPMGLYVINGMISNNGVMIPVADFVSNSDNLNKLKNRAVIVGKDKTTKPNEGSDPSVTTEETKTTHPNQGKSGSNDTTVSTAASSSSEKPSVVIPGNSDSSESGKGEPDSSPTIRTEPTVVDDN